MTARVTYFDRAPAYVAPRHTGVHAVRLQGMEAGRYDSIHLPAGTGRSVENRTPLAATLLVTISAG